jgi:hypothetical protein
MKTLRLSRILFVCLLPGLAGCSLDDWNLDDGDWRVAAPFPSYYSGTFPSSGHIVTLCLRRGQGGAVDGRITREGKTMQITSGTYQSFWLAFGATGSSGSIVTFEGTLYAENLFAPFKLEGHLDGTIEGVQVNRERLTAGMFYSEDCR